jgi:hypothetical protein
MSVRKDPFNNELPSTKGTLWESLWSNITRVTSDPWLSR